MATHTLSTLVPLNMPPAEAHHIGAYRKNGEKVGNISLGGFKPPEKTKLYSFGILSDVHNQSDQAAESFADLKNALTYFTNEKGVEFTVICGDLTQTYSNEAAELGYYADNVAAVAGHAPIYPTTGNHDCPSSGDVDIARFKEKTGTTDLYTSAATYSYEITKTHGTTVDHFLFLGMRRWNFSAAYLDSDITWLGQKLKEYQRDRCFIVTHLFFPDWSGNFGRYYPTSNWLSGAQLTALTKLARDYPRAIWFSGHSHWKWYLQSLEANANVYPTTRDRDMAQTVHIPSCASPIDSDDGNPDATKDRDDQIAVKESEGAVIDVFDDCIEIHGIEFKKNGDDSYSNGHIPIAHYRVYTNPYDGYEVPEEPEEPSGPVVKYMTAAMAQEHTGKNRLYKVDSLAALDSVTSGAGVYVDETTHDMTVKLCAVKVGLFVADGGSYSAISSTEGKMTGTDIAEGAAVTILHDGVEWVSTEPTSSQKAKIGFYGGGYAVGQSSTTYMLDSGVTVDTSKGCLQLQTSSSFSGALPAVFTVKNFRYSQSVGS